MDINEVKRKLNLSNSEIAEMFDYKDANSYSNSARKKSIDKGIVAIYKKTIEKIERCLK
ncbi:hypothetical protein FGF1_03520 [Flavobacteriaceae bacterium GF1]